MAKRATLKDVARLVGVTPTTVSYVINNKPGQTITPETRSRVLAAVAELHYVPNAHARTLRSQTSPCVGVVIRKNLAVPRFSQVVYGIQRRLAESDSNILLLDGTINPFNRLSDYVAAFLARRVEGIVFIGEENEGPEAASLSAIASESIPFVAYDCQVPSNDFSTIDLDYEGGARLLAEHVLGRGPARLLYVRPDIDTPQELLRERGVRAAAEAAGDVELLVRRLPVTLENLDTWDAHYSVGDTEEGLRLMEGVMGVVGELLALVGPGDAIVSSWAGWTHYFRKAAGRVDFVTGELANNGENRLAADLYTTLPNFEAGVACADEVLSLARGGVPQARTLKLSNVVEATLG